MVKRGEVVNHCLKESSEECQEKRNVARLKADFLTVDWSAGLINQTVAFDDAIGLLWLPPGHVYRSCGQFTEVDVAGSSGCF